MNPQKIGVIGAGLMGHGIAYLLAAAGHTVGIYDPSAEWRDSLQRGSRRRSICSTAIPRCCPAFPSHETMAPAMKDATFVFEAAPEKLPLKQQLFAELESLTASATILASNSSAIPSTRIGERLKHRERVIGTHFWNPPHLVPLVEVTRTRRPATRRCARRCNCSAMPGATRFTLSAICPALSATGCSMP